MNKEGDCDELYRCKLVMVGEQAVGKSSIVLQFVNSSFEENYKCTIGASFLTKRVSTDEKLLQFDIWDTAGLERFQSLVPMYYRGAHAALVVYDITNQESFLRAKTWVNEIKEKADSVVVIALAGNKSDRPSYRSVSYDNAGSFAKDSGLMFTETSAKTGENINTLFVAIAKECSRKKAWQEPCSGRASKRFQITEEGRRTTQKKSCCQS